MHTIYVDLDLDLDTSTSAPCSDPPGDDEQLSLPPVDPPDEEDKEEPVVEPTAAEIVQAGVVRVQLDNPS